jgi:ribosomal-protein-alanine N-acetyltransferase
MTKNYPPYKNFPMLSSNQVILREIINADADEIMEISYYDGRPASNLNEAIEMQRKINQDYLQGNSIHWGIVDAHDLPPENSSSLK